MLSSQALLNAMSLELGMLPSQLAKVIATAPLRYKVFTIPKRDGTPRVVAQPAKEVKVIQRYLISRIRGQLPVHASSAAYGVGCSIKKNAMHHVASKFILKMDFSDFFTSVKYHDLLMHLKRFIGNDYDDGAIELIARSCTWAPNREPPLRLCIGAPSSPFLSNSMMFDFDSQVNDFALAHNVTYTRYADDLTFSCSNNHVLASVENFVKLTLRQLPYPLIKVNSKKTVFASRAGRRTVTGINITPDAKLSVGRERKKLVRAMYHRLALGLLTAEEIAKFNGLINFIDDIEPGFSKKLFAK